MEKCARSRPLPLFVWRVCSHCGNQNGAVLWDVRKSNMEHDIIIQKHCSWGGRQMPRSVQVPPNSYRGPIGRHSGDDCDYPDGPIQMCSSPIVPLGDHPLPKRSAIPDRFHSADSNISFHTRAPKFYYSSWEITAVTAARSDLITSHRFAAQARQSVAVMDKRTAPLRRYESGGPPSRRSDMWSSRS
jgi:hypothetical protein